MFGKDEDERDVEKKNIFYTVNIYSLTAGR